MKLKDGGCYGCIAKSFQYFLIQGIVLNLNELCTIAINLFGKSVVKNGPQGTMLKFLVLPDTMAFLQFQCISYKCDRFVW